jgi:hypothetical protein
MSRPGREIVAGNRIEGIQPRARAISLEEIQLL